MLAHIASRRHSAHDAEVEFEERMTLRQRAADRSRAGVAPGPSSGPSLSLALWAAWNVLSGRSFDPYPFIFLNLILSMLAAIQAPVIMMSQNRQAEIDRRQAARDHDVNLRAEIEIFECHAKLDRLAERLP